jgi:hypothetical protein
MQATKNTELIQKIDPRRMSGEQLAALGVQILNKYDLLLECRTCGETWTAQTDSNGRLAPGYWECPNRCNV